MTGSKQKQQQVNWDHPVTNYGKAPRALNESTLINGRQVSSRKYTPYQGWKSSIDLPDYEQRSLVGAGRSIQQLYPQIQNALALNPNEQNRFTESLYQPQRQKLMDEYRNVLGETVGNANSSGMLDSIGFQNYRTNQLDKNLTQGLSDLYNQSYLQSFNLPQLKLAPMEQALNMYKGIQGDITNRAMQTLEPSFQGSQAGTNWASTRYNAEQSRLIAELNEQARRAQQPGGGFFKGLFKV